MAPHTLPILPQVETRPAMDGYGPFISVNLWIRDYQTI